MSTATFGRPNNFVIGSPGNPPDGTLLLTYTIPVPPSLSINPASFTYTNVGQPQTYTVTFADPVHAQIRQLFRRQTAVTGSAHGFDKLRRDAKHLHPGK